MADPKMEPKFRRRRVWRTTEAGKSAEALAARTAMKANRRPIMVIYYSEELQEKTVWTVIMELRRRLKPLSIMRMQLVCSQQTLLMFLGATVEVPGGGARRNSVTNKNGSHARLKFIDFQPNLIVCLFQILIDRLGYPIYCTCCTY